MKKKRDYIVGRWQNFLQYRCGHCPYDTLEAEQMEAHLLQEHGVQAQVEMKNEPGGEE